MNSTLILVPASVSLRPYAAPAATTSAATCALRAGGDGDVEEARPGDRRPRRCPSACAQPRRPGAAAGRAGFVARLLGQLQRDVGGVVAVLLLPRALDRHLGRHAVGQRQRALVDQRGQGGDDRGRRAARESPAKRIGARPAPSPGFRERTPRWVASGRTLSPRSSGDRAPPSGGGSVGSNPAGGAPHHVTANSGTHRPPRPSASIPAHPLRLSHTGGLALWRTHTYAR